MDPSRVIHDVNIPRNNAGNIVAAAKPKARQQLCATNAGG